MKPRKPIPRGQPPRHNKPLARNRKPLARSRLVRKVIQRIKNTGRPRFKQGRDPQYLEWIRGLPCLLKGRKHPGGDRVHSCLGTEVQATHLKSRGASGADYGNVLPLDAAAHGTQHLIGLETWAKYWGYTVDELRRIAAEVYPKQYEKAVALGWKRGGEF